MTKIHTYPLLLILSVLVPSASVAAPKSEPLDLTRAHSLARAHNPNMKTLAERVIQADLLINKAWSMILPSVSADAAITRNSQEVVLSMPVGAGPPMNMTIQEEWNKRFGITARMALFNARSIPLIKNAYDNRLAARFSSTHSRGDLLLAVSSAYYQVHATRQLVRTGQENLTTARRFQQGAPSLRKVGPATSIDTHRAEIRVLAAEKALSEAEDSVKLARSALATLLGLEQDGFTLADPPEAKRVDGDLDTLTRRALKERLDLKALGLARRMAARNRTESGLAWLPVFEMTYNWRYDSAGGFTGENDTWQFVFGARWSRLEGGKRVAAIYERRSKHREAENKLRQRVLDIRQEVRRGQLELRKTERNLSLAARQLKLAEQTYALISKQYRAGVTSSLEVVNAGAELESRRVSRVVERLRRDLARLKLTRALGG